MATDTKMQIRCTEQEKKLWQGVAGEGRLSEWVRDTLNRASTPPMGETTEDYIAPRKLVRADHTGHNRDYVFGPDDDVPRKGTPEELRQLDEEEAAENVTETETAKAVQEYYAQPQFVEVSTHDATNGELGIVSFTPSMLEADFDDAPPEPEDPDLLLAVSTPSHERDESMNRLIAEQVFQENERLLDPTGVDAGIPSTGQEMREDPPDAPDPTCKNAVDHWKLVKGERCKFCGGGVA